MAFTIDPTKFQFASDLAAGVKGKRVLISGAGKDYGLGQSFADTFAAWEEQVAPYKTIFIIVLIVVAVLYLAYRFLRNPIPTGDPEEVPLIGHQIATHMPGHDNKVPANAEMPQPGDPIRSMGHLGNENRPASGPGG